MEIAPLLIHIGFHKTASTWLQQDLFIDECRGFTVRTGESRQQIIMRIGVPDPLFYDPSAVREHYKEALGSAQKSGLTLVLSHEQLSGHPSGGGRDRCIIADRLHATFPHARILIVFREQRALIQSMYSQHITAGGVESLKRYLETPEPYCLRRPTFSFAFYEFDRIIEYYKSNFGDDKVLALPLELLMSRPNDFSERISKFCGHDPVPMSAVTRKNVRRSQLMQLCQRPLNMLFYHNDLSPGALIHIPRFNDRYQKYFGRMFEWFTPKFVDRLLLEQQRRTIEQAVGIRYAKSNHRTKQITGYPLEEFGYLV